MPCGPHCSCKSPWPSHPPPEVAIPIAMAHSPVQSGLSSKHVSRIWATRGREEGYVGWSRCGELGGVNTAPPHYAGPLCCIPGCPCLVQHSQAWGGGRGSGAVTWRCPFLAWSYSGQSGRDVGCHETASSKSPLQVPFSLSPRVQQFSPLSMLHTQWRWVKPLVILDVADTDSLYT